jgi:predicted O-methyltransferase YrrM
VLWDPEPDNFTYEIVNERELATWVAMVASCEPEQMHRYLLEPEVDRALEMRLQEATAGKWLWTKSRPPFGKRLGRYALARTLRPRLIIEVGVHDGLGALLLLRALERNTEDGYPGRLVSFDVNPKAGWLVGQHPLWNLRIEASQQGLPALFSKDVVVDMFIYDGWHSYEAESADLSLTADHLAPDGVLLSDDAQVTRALADICRDRTLAYFEFNEVPRQHFYPGGFLAAGRRPDLACSVRGAEPAGNG